MTNYQYILKVLQEADTKLSGKQIFIRVQKYNSNISRPTVSTILKKLQRDEKVDFDWEQCGRRRMKFFYPLDEGDGK